MMSTPAIVIGRRRIAADEPAYVIAEIGVNHNGSADLAHRMIDSAKACSHFADSAISGR